MLKFQDLNVRGKNKKERLVDIFSSFQKTGDEILLNSTQKDIDDFFESEKSFLLTYHTQLKVNQIIDVDFYVKKV